MEIYLSNNTFVRLTAPTPDECEHILTWFRQAEADHVLSIDASDAGTVTYLQKRHIVRIEVPKS